MKISTAIVSIVFVFAFTSCATNSEYFKQQAEAAKELPAYEQAFREADCFNLRFKLTNGMPFGKNEALNSLKCLEIERSRNELRMKATGMIQEDELTAKYAYDNYRAIFTFLAQNEISLKKARELYGYVAKKSNFEAQQEISRSNALLAQGLENQRRAWEQENRNREVFLRSLMQPTIKHTPIVTTCNRVIDSVICTTQ